MFFIGRKVFGSGDGSGWGGGNGCGDGFVKGLLVG